MDCVFTSKYPPSSSNFTTKASYNESLFVLIGTYINDYLTSLSDFFPVIFDLGSRLAISPPRIDFIGYITPIPARLLGSTENGTIIDGKGIVEWSFTIIKKTLIVKSEYYYVPDRKPILIIHQ